MGGGIRGRGAGNQVGADRAWCRELTVQQVSGACVPCRGQLHRRQHTGHWLARAEVLPDVHGRDRGLGICKRGACDKPP